MTSGLPNKLKLVNNFKDNNSDSDTIFSYIILRFSSQKKIQKAKFSSFLQIHIIILSLFNILHKGPAPTTGLRRRSSLIWNATRV